MTIQPIETKADYQKSLSFIVSNFEAKANSKVGRFVKVLAILVEKYEEEHFPIDAPTPVEAIKFRMEQLGISKAELAKLLGTRSRVSEIFNGKRDLSIKMIRSLHKKLNIPAESLLGI